MNRTVGLSGRAPSGSREVLRPARHRRRRRRPPVQLHVPIDRLRLRVSAEHYTALHAVDAKRVSLDGQVDCRRGLRVGVIAVQRYAGHSTGCGEFENSNCLKLSLLVVSCAEARCALDCRPSGAAAAGPIQIVAVGASSANKFVRFLRSVLDARAAGAGERECRHQCVP